MVDFRREIEKPEYDFLRENDHLGSNVCLLTVGGSHAYGTSVEGSDIDIRGCALNSAMEILTGTGFEQVINNETDTTIYSFNKLVFLLTGCNPNVLELLGCLPEHYLVLDHVGEMLVKHSKLFLSRRAAYTFGGYANAQLRRLDNKAARNVGQAAREKHVLNSINNMSVKFREKYAEYPDDAIKLYIDASQKEEMESEIFMDVTLHHYPLRDYKSLWSEMNNVVKDYATIGKRNAVAIAKGKLGKHMMHLVRLYYTCFDILEQEKIITYREKEHDLLMDIRAGKYLDENSQPIPEFFEMVDELEKRLVYARENTSLPVKPDFRRIQEFTADVNRDVVTGRAEYWR